MRANAKQIALATGGTFLVEAMDPRELVRGVSWDSRAIRFGDLYVALPGERVDGHRFVAPALRNGARAVLVTMRPDDATCLLAREMGAAVIEVPNTAHAVTDLARWWRTQLHGLVIGITGSTGKTTTKNLVRDVIAAKRRVVATEGNQNNELGVPKTILSADPETEAIVVEMGMRGLRQIAELCDFVRPHWGLVTNVGTSHIELLGSRENIAAAKSELIASLPAADGVAFLNGADDMSDALWNHAGLQAWPSRRVCFDGSGAYRAQADPSDWRHAHSVWAENIVLDDQGRPGFDLCASGFSEDLGEDGDIASVQRRACRLLLRGAHNVANACAAAAVGMQLGLGIDDVVQALSAAEPEQGRAEVVSARGGFTVINDAYNANPDSMRAALNMLASLDVPGSRVAVLGDMLELGDHARACHEDMGRLAAGLGIDCVVCIGEQAQFIAAAAQMAGMPAAAVVRADTVSDVLGELDVRLHPGDAVLVKASHSMGLARVVEGLVN